MRLSTMLVSCCAVALAAVEPAEHGFDLASVANMGFTDPVAGDGVGGWSDQGPTNDFAGFDHRRNDWLGVRIPVADPASFAGRAVLTMHSPYFPAGPRQAAILAPPGAAGRYLYLLHTTCWNQLAKGSEIGRLRIDGAGGQAEVVVRSGIDVEDWWNPAPQVNGWVVATRPSNAREVGVYLSRFDLGRTVPASSLTCTTTGAAIWIVIGATLTDRLVALSSHAALTIEPSDAWRPIRMDFLEVVAGSALDFSPLVGAAPAGVHGRVVATPEGHLAFAGRRLHPVRFMGCSTSLENLPEFASTEQIDRYLAAVRRQGYNLVRPHFLDHALMRGASAPFAFDQDVLRRFDHFVWRCKQLGLYLYLDAVTSWTAFLPVNGWSREGKKIDLKSRVFADGEIRQHWRRGVGALLTRVNPLTGMSLAEDPVVAAILPWNEQEIRIWHHGAKGPSPIHAEPWRAFLATRYLSDDAWRQAWGDLPTGATRAEAPLFDASDLRRGGRRQEDAAAFLIAAETGMADWFVRELRGMGYQGLITQFDYLKELVHTAGRSRSEAVAMHAYCMHPTDFNRPGSRVGQSSALVGTLDWLTGMAATRLHGRPFLVTEYGQVYWNRHRCEEGLAVGGLAALQGWDLLMAHANPVLLSGRQLKPFAVGADPIARAAQVVQMLLFLRGDLAASPHRAVVPVRTADLLAASAEAPSAAVSRLSLLCGLAISYDPPALAPVADAVVPFAAGSRVESCAGASTVVAGGDDGSGVAILRRAGILPAEADPVVGRFLSDTRELAVDRAKRLLRVETFRTCGIVGAEPLIDARAGGLSGVSCDTPASIVASSLDGAGLAASRRILLVIATDARNQGESYADSEGIAMEVVGTGPTLMRTGHFALTVAGQSGVSTVLFPLALDGTRGIPIPVRVAADGATIISIDTARLPDGPTPFFELLREASP